MRNNSRAGFTLVELMVAMALAVFLMVIMSQAFVTSLDTFRGLKAIGDMQEKLRTAETLLRDDLAQKHFTGERRLSDWDAASGKAMIVSQPPNDGFFAVRRGSAASSSPFYIFEGNDTSGLPSYRAADHMLYMTVRRKGNRPENYFNASLQGDPASILTPFFNQKTAYNMTSTDLANSTYAPPYIPGASSATYSSQWAEVLYYLVRTGTTTSPIDPNSPVGTPTYSLYRAQWVMVPDATGVNTLYAGGPPGTIDALARTTFAGMSCYPGGAAAPRLIFFTPDSAAKGQRVIQDFSTTGLFNTSQDMVNLGTYISNNPLNQRVFAAATLVVPNVVSFQVQVMPLPLAGPGAPSAFDDASSPGLPGSLLYDTTKFGTGFTADQGLKAIQITIRVFDNVTLQTRQTTIVQDL